MPYQITKYTSEILLLKVTGLINNAYREEFLIDLKQKCELLKVRKAIIDLNESKADTSYLEDFNFGSYISHYLKGLKIAIYLQGSGKAEMVQQAAKVRGLKTGIFPTIEKAHDWLNFQID